MAANLEGPWGHGALRQRNLDDEAMLGHGESEDIAAAAAHEGVDEARQHPLRLRGYRETLRARAAQHYHKMMCSLLRLRRVGEWTMLVFSIHYRQQARHTH